MDRVEADAKESSPRPRGIVTIRFLDRPSAGWESSRGAVKVLQFSTWQEPCGIAGYTGTLVGALADLGVTCDVHPVNARARRYLTRAENEADLERFAARAVDFDLVHIQHEFSFFDSRHLARSISLFARTVRRIRAAGRPVITTFHTQPPFRRSLIQLIADRRSGRLSPSARAGLVVRNAKLGRQWQWQVARLFRGHQRLALVHTKTTRRSLIEEGRFTPENVRVIPMGVVDRGPRLAAMNREDVRRQLGYSPDAIVVSMFGFVQAFKGYEIALRAMAQMPRHWQLAVVGGPHPESRADRTLDTLLRLRRSLRLGERVRVTGFADFDTLDRYHVATDMCIAPYHHGDLISGSAGVTWALSSGKPVVASDIPAFKELQEDANCLLLFAEDGVDDLAWQMNRVASDQQLRFRLVESAKAFATANLWPVVAKQVLDIYESALGR